MIKVSTHKNSERISARLTNRAVRYVDDKAGSYTYLYDGQGNITQNLRNGREANSYYYDPFGKVEGGTEENDIIFGYNGEEYTEATGLQYLRQRHYAPDTGMFLTQDFYRGDLYEPASQNRYTYAENDPVNYNDPGGDKKTSKNSKNSSNSIATALKTVTKSVTTNALKSTFETAAKTAWTTGYKANNRNATTKQAETAYYVAKGVSAGLRASEGLQQLAESLKTGGECGGKPNNASRRGTREPAGKRREYTVPLEDRTGVWAFGLEAGGTVGPASIYYNPQIVVDAKGNSKKYAGLNVQGEIDKNMISKVIESIDRKKGLEGGIGATWNFVNAKEIDVYTEGKSQNVGFSTKNFSISFTRYLYKGKYYYGYAVGIGYYTPGVELGNGFGVTRILKKIREEI